MGFFGGKATHQRAKKRAIVRMAGSRKEGRRILADPVVKDMVRQDNRAQVAQERAQEEAIWRRHAERLADPSARLALVEELLRHFGAPDDPLDADAPIYEQTEDEVCILETLALLDARIPGSAEISDEDLYLISIRDLVERMRT